MAYDPKHQVVVLYGGLIPDQFEGSEAADTWTWNGGDWTEASVGNSGPSYRDGPRMATAGNRVLMFGGHVGNVRYFGDTWTWDGANWSRVDHGPTPQGRGDAAIAWDSDDSSLFVYGGLGIRPDAGPGNLGLALSDAWSMKNGAWVQLPASGRPIAANGNAIWDSMTHRVVVAFGIACPDPITAGWSWDGATGSEPRGKAQGPAPWRGGACGARRGGSGGSRSAQPRGLEDSEPGAASLTRGGVNRSANRSQTEVSEMPGFRPLPIVVGPSLVLPAHRAR